MHPSLRLASYGLFPRPRRQAPDVPSPRPLPSASDQLGLGYASNVFSRAPEALPSSPSFCHGFGSCTRPRTAFALGLGCPLGLSSRLCSRTSQLLSSRRPREASPSSPDAFVLCLRASRLPLSLSPAKLSAFQGSLPSLVLCPGCLDRLSAPNPRLRDPSRSPPASPDSSPGPLRPSLFEARPSSSSAPDSSLHLLSSSPATGLRTPDFPDSEPNSTSSVSAKLLQALPGSSTRSPSPSCHLFSLPPSSISHPTQNAWREARIVRAWEQLPASSHLPHALSSTSLSLPSELPGSAFGCSQAPGFLGSQLLASSHLPHTLSSTSLSLSAQRAPRLRLRLLPGSRLPWLTAPSELPSPSRPHATTSLVSPT